MRSAILVVFLLLPMTSAAQGRYNGSGYGYYGLDAVRGGDLSEAMSAGGGMDLFIWKGLAAGFDVGYLFPRRDSGDGIGLLSANPSWHFVNRDNPGKVVPFVTAGYGLAFRSGTLSMVNYGGGATWWMLRRMGLRVEVRNYQHGSDRFNTALRFGVAFR